MTFKVAIVSMFKRHVRNPMTDVAPTVVNCDESVTSTAILTGEMCTFRKLSEASFEGMDIPVVITSICSNTLYFKSNVPVFC